jgi:hypothetical protein
MAAYDPAVALAAPALILRKSGSARRDREIHARVRESPSRANPSPSDPAAVDVYRWENEGGAPPIDVIGGIREPAHAARNAAFRS